MKYKKKSYNSQTYGPYFEKNTEKTLQPEINGTKSLNHLKKKS